MCGMFLRCVLAFVDSLAMFRSKVTKLSSYKQEYLAQHFCKEAYNSHNATDDVNMLVKILYKSGRFEFASFRGNITNMAKRW